MIVKILGDKRNDYNGILVARFKTEDITHELEFNLDHWHNQYEHGWIGGEGINIFYPEPMQLKFDMDYEVDTETARKIYTVLVQHGWKKV
jgi:hypothetical protein